MDSFLSDLRYAVRALRKSPGYAALAVLCLALGIGTNTTIFSAINGMLLRPLGFEEQDRLVRVWQTAPKRAESEEELSAGDFQDFRDRSTTLEGIALYDDRTFSLGGDGSREAAHVEGEAVSWNAFQLLGVRPMLGRTFMAQESVVGQHQVVILGYNLWTREFAADRDIVGRPVLLDGTPYVVVGVMPPRMRFPNTRDVWVPLAFQGELSRVGHGFNGFGKLKPGVSVDQASDELVRIAAQLAKEHPETNAGYSARATPFRTALVDEYRAVLWTMLGAVSFVLLIACGNVANLLLARATARQREIAVRTALGASRWRIVRQLLTEGMLLAITGGALGVLIAIWGLDLVEAAIPYELPFWMYFSPDWRVLSYTLAVSLLTGCLFSVAPALQSTRVDINEALKEGARGASSGARGGRLRSALVIGEVALCLVLLVGATLMMRSFVNLRALHPGFRTDNVLTSQLMLPGARYADIATRARFFERLIARLEATPSVRTAAVINYLPLSGSNTGLFFEVEGKVFPPDEQPLAQGRSIAGGYFRALDIPLVAGRSFTVREETDTVAARALVVNETMARRFWPGESALGKRIRWGKDEPWLTVVGVARDVLQRKLNERATLQIYLPYPEFARRSMTLVVRTDGDPARVTAAVREAVRELDPIVPVYETMTLDAVRLRSTWDSRLFSSMFLIFGVVALFLASIGLYGVMSYSVAQRTHEIGIRMALGAQVRDVLALVVGRGSRLALIGVVTGLVLAAGVTRLLKGMLFGISPADPLSFAGIALLLTGIALLASYVPARRATQVDPMTALRAE